MNPSKVAELIVMLFGIWSQVGPRSNVLDGGPDPPCKETILRVKRGRPGTFLDMSGGQYTQSDSAGGSTGMVLMPIGVY